MKYEKLLLEIRNSIAIVTLNEPSKLNALSLTMIQELMDVLDRLDTSARVLIVRGAGRGFCSGAGLDGGMGDINDDAKERDMGLVLEELLNPLMLRLRGLPIPWIAAVNGAAAGFGASLALMADLIIASDKAYFLQSFVNVGLVPDGGASHILVKTLGRARATQLMLMAEKLPAVTALEWGLINWVVPDASLDTEAYALATRLAQGPAVIQGLIRLAIRGAEDLDWEAAVQNEREFQYLAGQTEDFIEGLAAFNEKRAAKFRGC